MTETRVVLIKPGDVLLIGNAGPFGEEMLACLDVAVAEFKKRLGIDVTIFDADITIGVGSPHRQLCDVEWPQIVAVEPGQHRCSCSLEAQAEHGPGRTEHRCECGSTLTVAVSEAIAEVPSVVLRSHHRWLRHGHPCCGLAPAERPDGSTVRCGGPRLCQECKAAAAAVHGRGAPR